jgi:hypothetical protein
MLGTGMKPLVKVGIGMRSRLVDGPNPPIVWELSGVTAGTFREPKNLMDLVSKWK